MLPTRARTPQLVPCMITIYPCSDRCSQEQNRAPTIALWRRIRDCEDAIIFIRGKINYEFYDYARKRQRRNSFRRCREDWTDAGWLMLNARGLRNLGFCRDSYNGNALPIINGLLEYTSDARFGLGSSTSSIQSIAIVEPHPRSQLYTSGNDPLVLDDWFISQYDTEEFPPHQGLRRR